MMTYVEKQLRDILEWPTFADGAEASTLAFHVPCSPAAARRALGGLYELGIATMKPGGKHGAWLWSLTSRSGRLTPEVK